MKNILRYSIIFAFMTVAFSSFAQNDIDVSHYMFDEISYNPAFTGEGETFRASLLGRKQWLGFNGSPLFETLSLDGATKKFGGFGLHVVNDKLGFENVVTGTFNYSYGVNLGEYSRLTAGFAAGIIDRYIDISEFVYQNQVQVDPEGYEEDNMIIPTINVGLRLQVRDLAVGASVTHIASSLKNATMEKLPRHIYGYAKYSIRFRENFAVVPSLLVKYGSAKTQVEGNTNAYFNNKFWVGASYRVGESIVAMGGIILRRRIFLGYSYDWNVGSHGRYSYGSHEIFMSWRMRKDPHQQGFYQSTRLFN
ncbi:MAG: type IX secretion system membrane protein PorP/SprF [Bacteroidales bacterium]|nr:type IX secretion system membrane protein PorP/SprF [Bacteroidales bacterium]